MSSDPPQAYDDAIDDDGPGVTGAIVAMVTAPVLAVAGGMAGLIGLFFEELENVLGVLSDLREFAGVLIAEGPMTILREGASVTSGELAEFGVAAFVIAVAVVGVAWMAWSALDPEIPLIDNLLPWR